MARVILLDDDGREAMNSEISPAVFAWLSQFVRANGGALRTVAGLPTRDEAHALVLELEAFILRGAPLSYASAARLSIIVTGAAFVRRFGRPVVVNAPPASVFCQHPPCIAALAAELAAQGLTVEAVELHKAAAVQVPCLFGPAGPSENR